MSELKIKFSVYEKRISMQVIEQASDITGTVNRPIDFKASNGIVISSKSRPGLYPSTKEISLRGDNSSADLDIVYGKFNSFEEQQEFLNEVSKALNELFVKISNDKLKSLINYEGKEIRFKNCSILFTRIQGQILIQLLKSNFSKLPKNCAESDQFTINRDTLEIKIPKNTNVPMICMIQTIDLTQDEINNFMIKLFTILSESEVLGELIPINDVRSYPDYIFETV